MGKFDQQRVDYIRTLKEELSKEISSTAQSKYFTKTKSIYSELNDFDIPKMQSDYAAKFYSINKDELLSMINFAIYYFHLR